jgi:drug/metabolite transporter (DMT)-like permease
VLSEPDLMKNLSSRQISFILMVTAMCCLPGMDAMAKYLSQTMPVMQVIWFRYLGQFLVVLCILSSKLKASAETDNLGTQLLRSGTLFGTTICFFFALESIDQGQAAATFQVAPLIISLLAMLFLRERLGVKKCLGILIGFTGAIIIVQPQQFNFSTFALLPILAATFYAIYAVLTRSLGENDDARTTLLYTTAFGAVATCFVIPFVWVSPTTIAEISAIAVMVILASVGHFLLIRAFQLNGASDLAPLNYFGLVFALLWGAFLFNETPAVTTLIGSFLVVGAGLFVMKNREVHK